MRSAFFFRFGQTIHLLLAAPAGLLDNLRRPKRSIAAKGKNFSFFMQ